jgi:putative serine protease PepD
MDGDDSGAGSATQDPRAPRPQSSRSIPWVLAAGTVILALVAGVIGGLIGYAIHPSSGGASSNIGCDVTAVTSKVLPSLVTINVQTPSGGGTGSGSVINKEGDIITNSHVVGPPGTPSVITVDFARGTQGVQARLVGQDPSTDLAVIQVEGYSGPLTPVALGNSSDLVVGQPVVALGSPLGLNSTVTSGIVSALSRYINVGQGDSPALLVNAIQTDASINPGNSGGPLTNCSGQQVGINSAGAQVPSAVPSGGGSIGLNFAIPIDFALSIADELIQNGQATHPTIGVQGVTVTDEISKTTGLPRGALVELVIPGFGAARAGLQVGDVITAVDGTSVNSVDQMQVQVRMHQPGDTLKITYVRSGTTHTAEVPVTAVPIS